MHRDIQPRESEQVRPSSSSTLHLPGERVPFPDLHKDPEQDKGIGNLMIRHDHLSNIRKGSGGWYYSNFTGGERPNPKAEIWGVMTVPMTLV